MHIIANRTEMAYKEFHFPKTSNFAAIDSFVVPVTRVEKITLGPM